MAEELNEETQTQDSTTVEEVDVNIDEIFGNVGADNVMLPQEEDEKKPNIFSKPEELDTTFIDKPETTTTETPKKEMTAEEKIESTPDSVVDEALAELDDAM
jgi:hypothetical protein